MTSSSHTILILGLGNIGKEYEGSPHNAGFMVLDALAKKLNAQFHETKSALVWHGSHDEYDIVLAKPTTFMNKSGQALAELLKERKLPHENIWVVHDDVDLALGTIRIAQNRGAGGHKGITSLINILGGNDFTRFRIGIRPPRMPASRTPEVMNEFVIKPFGKKEKEEFALALTRCAEAVLLALEKGVARAMNEFN